MPTTHSNDKPAHARIRGRDRAPGLRYAKALFQVAREAGVAERVAHDLGRVAREISGHEELTLVLAHPIVDLERKRAILEAAFPDLADPVQRLLELLVDRGRSGLLPAILEAYERLWNSERRVTVAEATSAVALQDAECEGLSRALQDLLGGRIELRTAIKPSLLGGLQVKVEGRVFDGTIQAQLAALREHLGGASRS